MAKERYQTRLPEDKAKEVDEYKENRGISDAEAVRRLVLRGLDSSPQTAAQQPAAQPAEAETPAPPAPGKTRGFIRELMRYYRVIVAVLAPALVVAVSGGPLPYQGPLFAVFTAALGAWCLGAVVRVTGVPEAVDRVREDLAARRGFKQGGEQ